jgi:SAM-dependent methyltransferase
MFGVSFEERVKEQKSFLSYALENLECRQETTLAVDLGSGPGFQTIALAELGFSPVIAIDTSSELLDELRSHAGSLPIQTEKADLRDLSATVPGGHAAVIVCMGDTLTHLPNERDVSALFCGVFDALVPGGRFVITFRDLTTELQGTDRFILVRSSDERIMTCFLEYENPEYVVVHDLVHTRNGLEWSLSKSSYRKLRLSVDWLVQELGGAGLEVVSRGPAGRMEAIVTRKPLSGD